MKHNQHKYWNKWHLLDFTYDGRYEKPIKHKKIKQRLYKRRIKREDYKTLEEYR